VRSMRSPSEAILLCGGAGLRLRSVTGNSPKAMATVAGRPFLELLLRQLRRHDFERVILAVGYQQDIIRSHFRNEAFGLSLIYSAESSPLGTGGALRKAAGLMQSDDALVMNGDTYTDIDLARFLADYRESGAQVSMVVVPTDGRDDGGAVLLSRDGRVARFEEKQNASSSKFTNAGIYLMALPIICSIPTGTQISLENELFPKWLEEGKYMRAFVHKGVSTDIGTPDRYRSAQKALALAEGATEVYAVAQAINQSSKLEGP
jgi:NDP-sugar pyrophosphorylase family protein